MKNEPPKVYTFLDVDALIRDGEWVRPGEPCINFDPITYRVFVNATKEDVIAWVSADDRRYAFPFYAGPVASVPDWSDIVIDPPDVITAEYMQALDGREWLMRLAKPLYLGDHDPTVVTAAARQLTREWLDDHGEKNAVEVFE